MLVQLVVLVMLMLLVAAPVDGNEAELHEPIQSLSSDTEDEEEGEVLKETNEENDNENEILKLDGFLAELDTTTEEEMSGSDSLSL